VTTSPLDQPALLPPVQLEQLTVIVFDTPVAQGSMTGYVSKGRAIIHASNDAALKPWRKAVDEAAKNAARAARWTRIDGPLDVRIDFYLQRPAAAARRPWPCKAPDIDKLARAVLDGLKPHAIVDDSRIVRLACTKHYADTRPPGARITITNGVSS
jgi:Holliday junction resolvase RusA-like endonuclease